jgi:hypothetical protein
MHTAGLRISGTTLVRLAGAGLFWLATSGAADSPLQACRSIAPDAARLACYDNLADRPAPSTGAPATEAAPSPSPEELFGRDAVQSEDMVRRAAGIGRLEEITALVVGIEHDPFGKLILTLDNGQVWSQLDSPTPRIRAGDEVRIRRAALNSYLLTLAEGGHASRVRRSR